MIADLFNFKLVTTFCSRLAMNLLSTVTVICNMFISDYVVYSPPEVRPVHSVHSVHSHPSVYASLRDPLNATLAGLTLLGALLTVLTAQYFATSAALPRGGLTSGTSVVGYLILIGLFLLYSTNLSFVLTASASSCGIRRIGPSFSYAVIFSGMMIKVTDPSNTLFTAVASRF